jgi:hypothetical protein
MEVSLVHKLSAYLAKVFLASKLQSSTAKGHAQEPGTLIIRDHRIVGLTPDFLVCLHLVKPEGPAQRHTCRPFRPRLLGGGLYPDLNGRGYFISALRAYPVATTTPRGLPARGPRPAPGTDLVVAGSADVSSACLWGGPLRIIHAGRDARAPLTNAFALQLTARVVSVLRLCALSLTCVRLCACSPSLRSDHCRPRTLDRPGLR